jgi:hypothetical protein
LGMGLVNNCRGQKNGQKLFHLIGNDVP